MIHEMKMMGPICGFLMLWGVVLSSMAQSPPLNDSCTNPIVLSGTDISFSGTLAGATLEKSIGESVLQSLPSLVTTQTVWWVWTAPQDMNVIVEVLNSSQAEQANDGIAVWNLRATTPYFLGQIVNGIPIDSRLPHNFFNFAAKAGTNYQIQLAGSDNASFTFRLLATNSPYIIENPQTQTISTNDSAMFGVVATGLKPIGFQWQFKGTNLNGETAPILALNHVLTNQAGSYQVIITNSSGSITSQPANLFVTAGDTISLLAATHPPATNGFSFTLLGDIGRRYRILSSTNLTAWTNESSFATPFQSIGSSAPQFKSVVFDLTGDDVFVIPSPVSKKFLRATPFHAINEVCNNNLKMIRYATLLYAYDNQKSAFSSVTFSDISPYWKTGFTLSCPSGGTYEITTILVDPLCSVHPFEER
jgi:hypothetical protein